MLADGLDRSGSESPHAFCIRSKQTPCESVPMDFLKLVNSNVSIPATPTARNVKTQRNLLITNDTEGNTIGGASVASDHASRVRGTIVLTSRRPQRPAAP